MLNVPPTPEWKEDQEAASVPTSTPGYKAVKNSGAGAEEELLNDEEHQVRGTFSSLTSKSDPHAFRRWAIMGVTSLVILSLVAATTATIFSHKHGTMVAGVKIPEELIEYHESHPFDPAAINLPDEELAKRIKMVEFENQEANDFLEMSDEEVAVKFGFNTSSTEALYDSRRRLQTATVYHEPRCTVPVGACIPLPLPVAIPAVGPFIVPCGVCYNVGISDGGVLNFASGLEIEGKLEFSSTADVTILSTYIFIFGELKVNLPNEGNKVIFKMYGDQGHTYTAPYPSQKCGAGCNFGPKAIAVIGGRVDIKGYPDHCPPWEKLIGAFNNRYLLVSVAARTCWTPGTELLLTSHTRLDNDKQIVKVESYDPATGLVKLDRDIQTPITLMDSSDFAIEVASLSRRVKFDAENNSPLIGGHFIIHNTDQPQSLVGIEIESFGQQGTLGRYPLHFHDCGDSPNSLVQKNVIRNSNQRGYVIHKTNYVVLDRNVALEVVGHCYFLEAGTEVFNNFIGNLGAGVQIMPLASKLALSSASDRTETDDNPSVFWISNPQNIFIGNIAAGSGLLGFWIETDFFNERLKLNLVAFVNNEVHSSLSTAFTVYPPGWLPDTQNVIQNLKVYRNNGWGAFLHVTQNLTFQNCLFADNGKYAVLVNRGDNLHFENCKFIGQTNFAEPNLGCATGMRGIGLHPGRFSENAFFGSGSSRGSTLINTSFEKFSLADSKCTMSGANAADFLPLQFDSRQVFPEAFNAPHLLSGVTFDDPSQKLDMCYLFDSIGVDETVVEVTQDISMTFSSSGLDGFLVSSKFSAMLPSPEICETYSSCGFKPGYASPLGLDFCPGVCLRTVTVQTDPFSTANANLVVVDQNADTFKFVSVGGELRDSAPGLDRAYTVVLPKGAFTFFFQDQTTLAVMSPLTVTVGLEAVPTSCSDYFTEDDYNLLLP